MTTTTEHSTDLAETLAQSALLIKSRVAEAEKLSKLALADAEWLVLEIEKLIENGAPLQALFAAQDLAGMIVGSLNGTGGTVAGPQLPITGEDAGELVGLLQLASTELKRLATASA
jgi:hypothetical protein